MNPIISLAKIKTYKTLTFLTNCSNATNCLTRSTQPRQQKIN